MTKRMFGADLLRSKTTRAKLLAYFETHVSIRSSMGIDGLTRSGIDRMTTEAKYHVIDHVRERLRAGTYRFTSYRQVLVVKNSETPPRSFSIPTMRDALALGSILEVLGEATGKRGPELPQSVISRVRESVSAGTPVGVVRVDVKNFYPSIDHFLLERRLSRNIRHRPTRSAIMRAVKNGDVPLHHPAKGLIRQRGVPLGIAISSALAELYMSDFDDFFTAHPDVIYFRFVDDILILCPPGQSDQILGIVNTKLAELKLEAHGQHVSGKTFVGDSQTPFVYLGYRFASGRVSVGDAGMARMASAIAQAFSRQRHSMVTGIGEPATTKATRRLKWELDLLITGCIFEGRHLGWVKFYSQVNDLTQLTHLDKLIERKLRQAGLAVSVKRFIRTWHLINGHSLGNGYIPNLDKWSPAEMRDHLVAVGGLDEDEVRPLGDDAVQRIFSRKVRREVMRLERDIVGRMS